MTPDDPNVALIEIVAKALGPLNEQVVYIGGCSVGLLITDTTRPTARATQDVDLIAEVTGKPAYYEFSKQLKQAGCKEDTEIICRWQLRALKVDVMPMDETILGFPSRWYRKPFAMRLPLCYRAVGRSD